MHDEGVRLIILGAVLWKLLRIIQAAKVSYGYAGLLTFKTKGEPCVT
jgi:hypothetical protein